MLNDVLKIALENETKTISFYNDAKEKVTNNQQKIFFESMIRDIKKHMRLIKKHSEKNILVIAKADNDYGITEELKESHSDEINEDTEFIECVKLAMKKSEESMAEYENFANNASTIEEKNFFKDLKNLKQRHKAGLEQVYNQIAFNEVW